MPPAHKTPDRDLHRGISAALRQSFSQTESDTIDHVGAMAADADFAALLAQLNDPPPAYQGK